MCVYVVGDGGNVMIEGLVMAVAVMAVVAMTAYQLALLIHGLCDCECAIGFGM